MQRTNTAFILYSPEKQADLVKQELTGIWAGDIWKYSDLQAVARVGSTAAGLKLSLHFAPMCEPYRVEMKMAMKTLLEQKTWILARATRDRVSYIRGFLETQPEYDSLLSQPLGRWLFKMRDYIIAKGSKPHKRSSSGQLYAHPAIRSFKILYDTLENIYDPRPLIEREILDLAALCTNHSQGAHTKIRLSRAKQGWLREAFREYVDERRFAASSSTLSGHFMAVVTFSIFLAEKYPASKPGHIDREVIVDYISYLSGKVRNGLLAHNTRCTRLSYLNAFIDTVSSEDILKFAPCAIFQKGDIPSKNDGKYRNIPEIVIDQLLTHMNKLRFDNQVQLALHLESGARINEILALPLDPLEKDHDGDFWLKRYMSKQSKWHSVPVDDRVVAMVQELAQIVREKYGKVTNYLFPNTGGGKHASADAYSNAINRLIEEHNIVDGKGNLWKFQTHDVRHTVATKMLDMKIAFHLISDFLGHASPEMTRVYAAVMKAHTKVVTTGVQSSRRKALGNMSVPRTMFKRFDAAKAVKKHLVTHRLNNGFCELPVGSSCIDGPDNCIGCEWLDTDSSFLPKLESELVDEILLLERAKVLGHDLQITSSEEKIARLDWLMNDIKEQQ